jgi:hypothetical protein
VTERDAQNHRARVGRHGRKCGGLLAGQAPHAFQVCCAASTRGRMAWISARGTPPAGVEERVSRNARLPTGR